jgi:hypothetical protein
MHFKTAPPTSRRIFAERTAPRLKKSRKRLKNPESAADLLSMAVAVAKICDPVLFSLEDAIEHAKIGARDNPGFELHIVSFLQTLCGSRHVHLPMVFRGLDVLGGMLGSGITSGAHTDESRLITLLRLFLRSSDPQIVSKCVLVIGRQSRSMAWLSSVMGESDERIRANLIESLWNRQEEDIVAVLKNALSDPHPRVAANAVYGLHLIGNKEWIKGIERLTSDPSPAFRRSGIWMLKASGLSDAPARIKTLIHDTDPEVRRAAFDALIQVRHRSKTIASVDPTSNTVQTAAATIS